MSNSFSEGAGKARLTRIFATRINQEMKHQAIKAKAVAVPNALTTVSATMLVCLAVKKQRPEKIVIDNARD